MLKGLFALTLIPGLAFAGAHNANLRMYGPDQALGCQGTLAFSPSKSPFYYLENETENTYDGTIVLRSSAPDRVNMGCQSRVHILPHEYQTITCHLRASDVTLPHFGFITLNPEFYSSDHQPVTVSAVDAFGLHGPWVNGRAGTCTEAMPAAKEPEAESFAISERTTKLVAKIDKVSSVPFNTLQAEFSQAVSNAEQNATGCDQPTWVVTPIPTKVNQQLIPAESSRVLMFVKPVVASTCPTKQYTASFDFVSNGSPIKAVNSTVTMSNHSSGQLNELKLWTGLKRLSSTVNQVVLPARLNSEANSAQLIATRPLAVSIEATGGTDQNLFVQLDRPAGYRPLFMSSHHKK